jgi:hypothetical protein
VNVYVAGRTTDLVTVTRIADAIEAEGHQITFKWWGGEGEIRTDLKSEDLVMERYTPSGLGPQTVGQESDPKDCSCKITHTPTGEYAVGTGQNQLRAHDDALMQLRAKLNAGWAAKPERARELAIREIKAVDDADAIVLVWAPDILGAAIETGSAMGTEKKVYVYRPGRDSVFWYLPNVTQIWSLAELLDLMKFDDDWEEVDVGPGHISLDDIKDAYKGGGNMSRRASDHSVSADPTGADRARRTL